MYDDEFMRRAIDLSRLALMTSGVEPFGAVVVKNGKIVGEGLNHSKARHDPTSHGEVEAIRDACRRLESVDLSGCEIYTSCEPCPMCVAAMTIAGISKLYYAADLAQAGEILSGLSRARRHPVDLSRLIAEINSPVGGRRTPAEQHRAEEAAAVLAQWVGR